MMFAVDDPTIYFPHFELCEMERRRMVEWIEPTCCQRSEWSRQRVGDFFVLLSFLLFFSITLGFLTDDGKIRREGWFKHRYWGFHQQRREACLSLNRSEPEFAFVWIRNFTLFGTLRCMLSELKSQKLSEKEVNERLSDTSHVDIKWFISIFAHASGRCRFKFTNS